MTEVAAFCRDVEGLGIAVWIDGGWGVDALLRRKTRTHLDLDIVIQAKDVPALIRHLAQRGFRDRLRDDTSLWNFVMADRQGRSIDFHVIVLDSAGNGLYGPQAGSRVMYPASALDAGGEIAGERVRCVSAEFQIASRSGYPLREKDYADIRALTETFGLVAHRAGDDP